MTFPSFDDKISSHSFSGENNRNWGSLYSGRPLHESLGHGIHSPADFPNGKLHSVPARGSRYIFEQSPEETEWQSKGILEARVPKCQTHLFGEGWGRVTITGFAAAQPAELL